MTPRTTQIIKRVAELHKVTLESITSGRRGPLAVTAARRQVCVELRAMRLYDGSQALSLADIGRILGGRDHTTVLHHLTVAKEMKLEAQFVDLHAHPNEGPEALAIIVTFHEKRIADLQAEINTHLAAIERATMGRAA